MSDYPKGLRFDIYERLTLSEDATGISELEDIELVPRITMQTHLDQAVLSGDLLLTGTYVGVDEGSGVKKLSHRIPVEITLPLKRIKRMDSIGIEIENFDVELISARSLNITGVISLNGIDTAAEQSWQQHGEALFVHDADSATEAQPLAAGVRETASAAGEELPVGERQQLDEQHENSGPAGAAPVEAEMRVESSDGEGARVEPVKQAEEKPQPPPAVEMKSEEIVVEPPSQPQKPAAPEAKPQENIPAETLPSKATENVAAENLPSQPQKPAAPEAKPQESIPAEAAPSKATENVAAENLPSQPSENVPANEAVSAFQENVQAANIEAEGQKEMKIAFGSSGAQSDGWSGTAAGMKSLISKKSEEERTEEVEAVEAVDEAATEEERPAEDAVLWKNLLLSSEQGEQRFSKLRMCIVQKEETLEAIASRYDLNPKEILLYNRLETENVREGQVIYIPG